MFREISAWSVTVNATEWIEFSTSVYIYTFIVEDLTV